MRLRGVVAGRPDSEGLGWRGSELEAVSGGK